MRKELVSNIYNVTQISRSNDAPWEKMMDIVNQSEEDIEFDFDGIELSEPWLNDCFNKLMADSRVHLKVYNSIKIKDTIELMLVMNGYKTDRVINENIEYEYVAKVKTVDNQLERMVERFLDNTEIENGKGLIVVTNVVDQIGSVKTMDALENAIKLHSDKNNINEYTIDIESMFIQDNIMQRIADLIENLREKGINVRLLAEDERTANTIKTFQLVSKTLNISMGEKIKLIKESMELHTVGMLSKFKETRSKDLFGRCGEGKPVICRPAIYLGLKSIDGVPTAVFREFRVNTFSTRMDYSLEHDGEKHPGLETVLTKVPVSQLGLYNLFIGSLYQFSAPVQQSKDDYFTCYVRDENNKLVTVKRTLPEHIKQVLDDFKVKYDDASLVNAIIRTKDKLKGGE